MNGVVKGINWVVVERQSIGPESPSKNNHMVLKTNKVAPVVIKSCREEYQRYYAKKDSLVSGKISSEYVPHALLLVRHL